MTNPDASIIILTMNGGEIFPKLLESIYSQQYSGTFEVIVIDSGSTDGTMDAAKKYPVRLVQIAPAEFHHGRTRNLGAGMAQGRYLVYITQDALPLNNAWLQKLLDNFADPQVAMVVGRQIPWEHTSPPEKFMYYYDFPDFRIRVEPGEKDIYHNNNFVSNANSAIRKGVWQGLKFSETIVMAEDKELAARILANGGVIIYDPLAAVHHSHNFSIKQIFERALDYGVSLRQGADTLARTDRSRAARAFELTRFKFKFIKDAGWRCLPDMVMYDFCLYLGLQLGKYGLMSGPIKRKKR